MGVDKRERERKKNKSIPLSNEKPFPRMKKIRMNNIQQRMFNNKRRMSIERKQHDDTFSSPLISTLMWRRMAPDTADLSVRFSRLYQTSISPESVRTCFIFFLSIIIINSNIIISWYSWTDSLNFLNCFGIIFYGISNHFLIFLSIVLLAPPPRLLLRF